MVIQLPKQNNGVSILWLQYAKAKVRKIRKICQIKRMPAFRIQWVFQVMIAIKFYLDTKESSLLSYSVSTIYPTIVLDLAIFVAHIYSGQVVAAKTSGDLKFLLKWHQLNLRE